MKQHAVSRTLAILMLFLLLLTSCAPVVPEPDVPPEDSEVTQPPLDMPRSAEHFAPADGRFSLADDLRFALELSTQEGRVLLDATETHILYQSRGYDRMELRLFDIATKLYTVVHESPIPQGGGPFAQYSGRLFEDGHIVFLTWVGIDPPDCQLFYYKDGTALLVYETTGESRSIIELMSGRYTEGRALVLIGENVTMGSAFYYERYNYHTIDSEGRLQKIYTGSGRTFFSADFSERVTFEGREPSDNSKIIFAHTGASGTKTTSYVPATEYFDSFSVYFVDDMLLVQYHSFGLGGIAYDLISKDGAVTQCIVEGEFPSIYLVGGSGALFHHWSLPNFYFMNTDTGYKPEAMDITGCFRAMAEGDGPQYESVALGDGGKWLIINLRSADAVIFAP